MYMSYIKESDVYLTDRLYFQMSKYQINKDDLLWVFNYPNKEVR